MMISVIFLMMVLLVLLMGIVKKIDRQFIITWEEEKEDSIKTVNDQDKKKNI